MNWETIEEIKLNDGTVAVMEEATGPGMAGEPMSFVRFRVGETVTPLKDLSHLMNPSDEVRIRGYLDDVSNSNHASAVNWIR